MLKLYGFSFSNYFSMVKLALMEKAIAFEVVTTYPAQTEYLLEKSPRGKIPCLETPWGYLNETDAILDFLEESQGGKPLLPADPFARAQVRSLMKEIELYIELPARGCFAEAFYGGLLPEAVKEKSRIELSAGIATLRRHGKFAPYVAGAEFTLADIFFLYSITPARTVATSLFGVDLLADFPAAAALLERLNQRTTVQEIAELRARERPVHIAAIQARMARVSGL